MLELLFLKLVNNVEDNIDLNYFFKILFDYDFTKQEYFFVNS